MTATRARVGGELTVPGTSRSRHRSLICSALAEVPRSARDPAVGGRALTTAAYCVAGLDVPPLGDSITITGVGLRGLRIPRPTSTRQQRNQYAAPRGVVAGSGVTGLFVGDASLRGRSDAAHREAAERHGRHCRAARARWFADDGARCVAAGHRVVNETEVAGLELHHARSALFGRQAKVAESPRSRDHTERMLGGQGADVWGQ